MVYIFCIPAATDLKQHPLHSILNSDSFKLYYCILRGQIKGFNRSITTILCQIGIVIELWLGSYRTLE